jgi:hypothetical protein
LNHHVTLYTKINSGSAKDLSEKGKGIKHTEGNVKKSTYDLGYGKFSYVRCKNCQFHKENDKLDLLELGISVL